MKKDIVHKYSFTKEELSNLMDIQAGITIANAQMTGMQIYKDVILESVYRRLNLKGEPKKGFSKSISYSLRDNVIIHTESPIVETKPNSERNGKDDSEATKGN